MRADGMNVLIEGRKQTLDYVRTPHRFELTLSDTSIIGLRRAAQRLMGEALAAIGTASASDAEVASQLDAALQKLSGAAKGGAGPQEGTKPSAKTIKTKREAYREYAASHQVEASHRHPTRCLTRYLTRRRTRHTHAPPDLPHAPPLAPPHAIMRLTRCLTRRGTHAPP